MGELPVIKHIQVQLSEDEFELFKKLAHAAEMGRKEYARHIFIDAIKREQARLGLKAAVRPIRKA